jgi:hypothetical protein
MSRVKISGEEMSEKVMSGEQMSREAMGREKNVGEEITGEELGPNRINLLVLVLIMFFDLQVAVKNHL